MKLYKKLLIIIFVLFLSACSNSDNKSYLGDDALEAIDQLCSYLNEYHYASPEKKEMLQGAIEGIISSLDDDFTYFNDDIVSNIYPTANNIGYGVYLSIPFDGGEIYITDVIFDSPAYKAGLRAGDYIYMVEGKMISDLNYFEISELLDSCKTSMTVKIKRNEYYFDTTIFAGNYNVESLVSSKKISDTTGYLKITTFNNQENGVILYSLAETELKYLEELLPNMETLIIDVRGNLGGLLYNAEHVLNLFLEYRNDDVIYYTDGYQYINNNLIYKKQDYYAKKDAVRKNYDIKILIDENTASAAEVFAGVMQGYMGYKLIGCKSYGKGIYQYDVKFLDNSLHITLGKWYYNNKGVYKCIQNEGLTPDILVEDSIYYEILPPALCNNLLYDTVDIYEIKKIGLLLNALGYDVRIDGYYDSKMKEAIKDFFEKKKIDIDCEVITFDMANIIYNDYYQIKNDYDNCIKEAIK